MPSINNRKIDKADKNAMVEEPFVMEIKAEVDRLALCEKIIQ